jgi:hypothetical protein
MIGLIMFSAIIVALNLLSGPIWGKAEMELGKILFYAAISIAILCFFISRKMFHKKIGIVKNTPGTLVNKLNLYREAIIAYMAPCEGAALFSVIVFLLTGNFLVLLITTAMLVLMFNKFPFAKKVIAELDLNWKEQQELM